MVEEVRMQDVESFHVAVHKLEGTVELLVRKGPAYLCGTFIAQRRGPAIDAFIALAFSSGSGLHI